MTLDLERLARRSIASLTTIGRRSGKPRPVEVYFAYKDGKFYFLAHARSQWYRNLAANPDATLRIGETSLRIRAVVVDKAAGLANEVLDMFREKYGSREVDFWYKGTERYAVVAEVVEEAT